MSSFAAASSSTSLPGATANTSKRGKKAESMDFYQFVAVNNILLIKKRNKYPGYMSSSSNSNAAKEDIDALHKLTRCVRLICPKCIYHIYYIQKFILSLEIDYNF